MRPRKIILLIITLLTTIVLYILHQHILKEHSNEVTPKSISPTNIINIAVVACGERLQETLVMIKSALLFNHAKDFLRFLIFAEDHLISGFTEKLEDWRSVIPLEFDFEIQGLNFPPEGKWKSLFKPCAAQRLFLPVIKSLFISIIIFKYIYILVPAENNRCFTLCGYRYFIFITSF